MRKLLGALAVAGTAVLFSIPSANAATCWWNGYTWVCRTPSYYGYYGGYGWRHSHWRHHRWASHYWHRHHRHGWDYGRPYAWYR